MSQSAKKLSKTFQPRITAPDKGRYLVKYLEHSIPWFYIYVCNHGAQQ